MKNLTEKQRVFCEEYIKDFNASRSAIAAGYSESHAKIYGHRLLAKVPVKKELARLAGEITKRNDLQVDDIVRELQTLAFSNVQDYVEIKKTKKHSQGKEVEVYDLVIKDPQLLSREQASCIKKIQQTRTGISIELYDKTDALDKLMRHLGGYNDKESNAEEFNSIKVIFQGEANTNT